jgi:dihydrofolate synthase/folylpolyglutamate synthase
MSSYDDSVAYLDTFVNYEKRPPREPAPRAMGLDRVVRLLEMLGSPHLKTPCIHIAGTKGKGSTAAMVSSILTASGYRTGLYTSPHLVDVRERIRLDGEPIPRSEFARMMDLTRPHLERIKEQVAAMRPGTAVRRPTYFEIMTHMAFLYFADAGADIAVLEVGLGGRLDATNVVERPIACAVTNISRDHTAILGDTLALIAREKAGILKHGVPAVVARQPAEAAEEIGIVAREAGAPLSWLDREVLLTESEDASFDIEIGDRRYGGLTVPLLGAHQRRNAAVAVALVDEARRAGFDRIAEESVRSGLRAVSWPGRIQRVADDPVTILDGAHNPASIDILMRTLAEAYPDGRRHVVFAVANDKDWRVMLARMAGPGVHLTCTHTGNPRAVDPTDVAHEAGGLAFESVAVEPSPASALAAARDRAGRDDLVIATGSLYLVGALLAGRNAGTA